MTSTLQAPQHGDSLDGDPNVEPSNNQSPNPNKSGRGRGPAILGGNSAMRTAIAVGGPLTLILLAIFGFRTAYGGAAYFLAGAVGAALGAGVAWWSAHRSHPFPVTAATTVIVFFVFGGAVAVPKHALAGVIPTPASVMALVDGSIQGWARLLTISPPVGDTGNLLTLPYLCGLVSAVIAVSIALRTRRPGFAAILPLAVLMLGILFGTREPASLLLQGAVFGAILIGWLTVMNRRTTRVSGNARRSRRLLGGPAVLVLAGVVALLYGQSIPGAGSRARVVLRDHTEPPFDPADYPSPLSSYRRFTNGLPLGGESESADQLDPNKLSGLRSEVLFRVKGLPKNERLRLATMDSYDGVVYSVGTGPGSSGYFQRVGERFGERSKKEQTVTVEVAGKDLGAYRDIWLPTATGMRSLQFADTADPARAENLTEKLLVNRQTDSAVAQPGLQPGDKYEFTFVPTELPSIKKLGQMGKSKATTPSPVVLNNVSQSAKRFGSEQICKSEARNTKYSDLGAIEKQSFYAQIRTIADNLMVCGGFSDGRTMGADAPSGHGENRIDPMVAKDSAVMVGNGEQYAPLAALLTQAIGVPARVVLGFRSIDESNKWMADNAPSTKPSDETYEVRGADITAWIEVALGDNWIPIRDVTPTEAEPVVMPTPQAPELKSDPPPPPPSIPPSDEDLADANKVVKAKIKEDKPGFHIPAWVIKTAAAVAFPFVLIGLFTATVGGLKSQRRKRRRNVGTYDQRIDGGWDEVEDLALDLGSPVPVKTTRREAATLMMHPEALGLADRADGAVFGPDPLSEDLVQTYWTEVDATRAAMISELSRFGRWKALVSFASLRATGARDKIAKSAASVKGSAEQLLDAIPGRASQGKTL